MKKIMFLAAALGLLLSTPASAGYHHVLVAQPRLSPLFGGAHGTRFVCWANPAGFLICAIVVAGTIRTVQEIQKGCTSDPVNWPARFWMPVCNWKGPHNPYLAASRRGPRPLAVRG